MPILILIMILIMSKNEKYAFYPKYTLKQLNFLTACLTICISFLSTIVFKRSDQKALLFPQLQLGGALC